MRQVLEKLTDHGILFKNKKLKKDLRDNDKIYDFLGITNKEIYNSNKGSDIDIYCFNIDLMLILKARIFELRAKTAEKVTHSFH